MKDYSATRTLVLFSLLSALILPAFLMPIEVEAVVPIFTPMETPSLERTWDDVSLLYPNQYLNSTMVEEEIENIQSIAPDLIDVEVIGPSYEGRDLLSVRVTNEAATQQKAKTLLVAHHHGREMVTVNHAIHFIQWLVNSYGEDSQLTEYVDTEEIYVVPTVNPDALDYIYNTSDYWLRKNLRPYDDDGDDLIDEDMYEDVNDDGYVTQYEVWAKAGSQLTFQYAYYEGIDNDGDGQLNEDWIGHVDLNRNYDANWGIESGGSSHDPLSQVFCGTAPFSEPETQAFRDFALQHRFGMAYSLHTGINATYFVTNTTGNWIESSLYSQMFQDYEEILPPDFNYYIDYAAKANAQARPAILSGGWDEWMYHERDCLAPITFEIYNNATSESEELYYIHEDNSTHRIMGFNGIYEYFSPVESYIHKLWDELVPAYEYLLEQTPRITVSFNSGAVQNTAVLANMVTTCLSPRLETIDDIEVRLLDGALLDSIPSIDADTSFSAPITLDFTSAQVGENTTIKVGNEFTGYAHFLVSFTEGIFIDPLLIIGATIGIIAVVVIIVYGMKKR